LLRAHSCRDLRSIHGPRDHRREDAYSQFEEQFGIEPSRLATLGSCNARTTRDGEPGKQTGNPLARGESISRLPLRLTERILSLRVLRPRRSCVRVCAPRRIPFIAMRDLQMPFATSRRVRPFDDERGMQPRWKRLGAHSDRTRAERLRQLIFRAALRSREERRVAREAPTETVCKWYSSNRRGVTITRERTRANASFHNPFPSLPPLNPRLDRDLVIDDRSNVLASIILGEL